MKGLLFVYLMAYGGAFAALFRPYAGLLVYVILAVIRPESMWSWSIETGNFSRVVGIATLVGWLFQGLGSWRFGRSRGIVIALLGFWGWGALCGLLAPDKGLAWSFVDSMSKIVLPCLVGITLIDSVARLRQLTWAIVLSQAYVALDFNQSYFSGYNKLRDGGFGGMDNNCNAIALVTALGPAILLAMPERIWWRKGLFSASAALMLHAILFSNSRGGMLATVVASALIFILMPKRPQYLTAFSLAIVLGLALSGRSVRERFAMIFSGHEARDASAQSRLDLWADCWDAMLKRPVLGAGPRHWPLLAKYEYRWGTAKEAHSLWFQTGAELGFPGVILLMSYYGLAVVRLLPLARERCPAPDPWLHEGSRLVIVSIVGFAFSASFVSLQYLETPYYVTIVGAGILKLTSGGAPPRESPTTSAPPAG